jgi:hypothetical protein
VNSPVNYFVLNQRGVLGRGHHNAVFVTNLEAASPSYEVMDNSIVVCLVGQLQNWHKGLTAALVFCTPRLDGYTATISPRQF